MIRRPIKKVMLIYPPMPDSRFTNGMCEVPMGVSYLAAYLRERLDVEVRLLDSEVEGYHNVELLDEENVKRGLSYNDIESRVSEFGPDLVGISTIFSSQFPFVREIARRARAMDPDLFLVTGGAYPSFLPERALETSDLDAVVIGEGELPLEAIINSINGGGVTRRDQGHGP